MLDSCVWMLGYAANDLEEIYFDIDRAQIGHSKKNFADMHC